MRKRYYTIRTFCGNCGQEYMASRSTQRYCGETCARAAHIAQKRARDERTRRDGFTLTGAAYWLTQAMGPVWDDYESP